MIEQEGATAPLTELLNSGELNEYPTIVLLHLTLCQCYSCS